MRQVSEFVDNRLKGYCAVCENHLFKDSETREHIPPKTFLDRPFPDNLLTVSSCSECNQKFSVSEQYFSILLSCVISGCVEPSVQLSSNHEAALSRDIRLRKKIESARQINTDGTMVWNVEIDEITEVVIKIAKCHIVYDCGHFPYGELSHSKIVIAPLIAMTSEQRSTFFSQSVLLPWCEVGSRWNTRVCEGDDFDNDGFLVVQPNVYRYRIEHGGLGVSFVMREYLACSVWFDS